MLKKLILLLLIVAPVSIFAQDKIAYINSQELFVKMPEMKDVEAKLKAEDEAIRKNVEGIQNEYNTLVEKLSKDTAQLTEAVLLDRQNQVQALEKRYNEYVQKSSSDMEKSKQTLLAPLQEKLMKAIKEVGNENNYTYIIEAGALLFVGPSAIDANKAVKTKLGILD